MLQTQVAWDLRIDAHIHDLSTFSTPSRKSRDRPAKRRTQVCQLWHQRVGATDRSYLSVHVAQWLMLTSCRRLGILFDPRTRGIFISDSEQAPAEGSTVSISVTAQAGSSVHELDEASRSETAYRADIDGLRAVAIASVLAFHANPQLLPGGFCGVDVFFVISGFLISGIILRQLERGHFSFIEFYSRRIRRLFPALIVVLTVVYVMGWLLLLSDEARRLGKHMAAGAVFSLNLLLFSNTDPYFVLHGQQLTHLWSLGVEEQFYLFWPVLLAAIWKLCRKHFIPIVLALTLGSFAINLAQISWDPLGSFYLPWSRIWELSSGSMAAYFALFPNNGRQHTWKILPERALSSLKYRGKNLLGIAGAVLLAISFSNLHSTWEHPGVQGMLPVGGTLLLIAAGPNSWVNRFVLTRKSIVFVGLISYPLYLWHWPLLSFAHVATGGKIAGSLATGIVMVSVILAFVTYKFAELPIRSSPVNARTTAALLSAVLTFGLVGYLTATQKIPARSHSDEVMRFESAAENWLTGLPDTSWTALVPDFLVLGDGKREVLYIGDSFMQQYYLRISQLLKDHPLTAHRAVFAVRAACAPLLEVPSPFGRQACIEHGRKALEYAQRATVDAVVIASAWVYPEIVRIENGKYALSADVDNVLAPLRIAITSLRSEGKDVYLVLVSPMHADLDPRPMIRRTIAGGFRIDIPPDPPREEIESTLAAINGKLTQLATQVDARVIDPIKSLCNSRTCPSISPAGDPIYVGAGHIRPSYAKVNVRYLDETIIRGNTHRVD